MADHDSRSILRLVGVYDADGTWRGELKYWIGARFGRGHCSLCDVTHGSLRAKPEWKKCRAGLPVAFDTYHRDDQPERVRVALDGQAPAVVAETIGGVEVLLGPTELEACAGSIDALMAAVESALANRGLDLVSDR